MSIFGKRGAGKTTLIRGAIPHCRPPVVIVDVLGNFADEIGYHAKSVADAISFIHDYKKAETNGEITDEISRVVIVQAPDPDETVDFISAAMWHAGDCTLVLDEVDSINYASAPCFDHLIRYGRNRMVSILTGCRRPAEISKNITAGANRIFIFQTQEPRDVEYFKKTLLGEQAESLISLPEYQGIFIDYDKKQVGTFKMNREGEVFVLSQNKLTQ